MVTLLFDADGVLINETEQFSVRYSKKFGIPIEVMLPFFKGSYHDCKLGKKDLKEELLPFLGPWKWHGTVDALLEFWFAGENKPNTFLLDYIQKVRKSGVKCYLVTNNEKYRVVFLQEHLHFKELLDGIFSSADLGVMKSNPAFFEEVVNKTQEKKEDILYFDDEQKCVDTANAFGLEAFLFENNEQCKKIIREIIKAATSSDS